MQQISYYKYDTRALQFKYGTPEHRFYDYLIRKENYSRLKGLPIGQVDITVRTVAKDIEVTEKVARRLINQFIKDGFIELIRKANSKKESSIYILKTYTENDAKKGTVEGTVEGTVGAQLNVEIPTKTNNQGHSSGTVEGTVEGTPKINNIINNKNNNIVQNDFAHECDLVWKIYPNKKGKAKAYKKLPKLIKKYGYEQVKRCVERYSLEVKETDKQYIKHGDTFFNGAYIDYLDNNYIEPIKEQNRIIDFEASRKIKEQANKDLAAILGREL
ncbi:hypothetical protein [Clostridium sp. 2218st1_F5_2218SCRN_220325]|uniref:hypothetical protein n=1 Tax=Clostridium sp. 2218st1_F5_2218SCRN_220325 TaxID=3143056 RepID=UPI00319E191A